MAGHDRKRFRRVVGACCYDYDSNNDDNNNSGYLYGMQVCLSPLMALREIYMYIRKSLRKDKQNSHRHVKLRYYINFNEKNK